MVVVSNYNFKYLTDKIVKLVESFINTYVEKCLESESAISSMRIMRIILDDKYEKDYLNKIITEQCQHFSTK